MRLAWPAGTSWLDTRSGLGLLLLSDVFAWSLWTFFLLTRLWRSLKARLRRSGFNTLIGGQSTHVEVEMVESSVWAPEDCLIMRLGHRRGLGAWIEAFMSEISRRRSLIADWIGFFIAGLAATRSLNQPSHKAAAHQATVTFFRIGI